jgi:hypothetical protein
MGKKGGENKARTSEQAAEASNERWRREKLLKPRKKKKT